MSEIPLPIPPPPFGLPVVGGTFVNPNAHGVTSTNLLPSISTAELNAAPRTMGVSQFFANQNAGAIALRQNLVSAAIAPSVATNNTQTAVGSDGSVGLDGATHNVAPIAMTGIGAGVAAPSTTLTVDAVSKWQASNPTLDTLVRIGSPIAGFLLWRRGMALEGALVAAPGAYLWYNRLRRR